jgi:hypothetical protein
MVVPLSPYRPESFDGIVKNKLPGKLFFFLRSIRSSSVTYVRALYTGASQYMLIGLTAVVFLSVFEWAET